MVVAINYCQESDKNSIKSTENVQNLTAVENAANFVRP